MACAVAKPLAEVFKKLYVQKVSVRCPIKGVRKNLGENLKYATYVCMNCLSEWTYVPVHDNVKCPDCGSYMIDKRKVKMRRDVFAKIGKKNKYRGEVKS